MIITERMIFTSVGRNDGGEGEREREKEKEREREREMEAQRSKRW